MGFIDDLREKSNKECDSKQKVIEEIKEYFDEHLYGDCFENHLKKLSQQKSFLFNLEKREMLTFIYFDKYDYDKVFFCCCDLKWESQTGFKYKGVELVNIHKEICEYLATKLKQRMEDLGFNYLRCENEGCWLEYANRPMYYFGW